jgi:hypothetical protein
VSIPCKICQKKRAKRHCPGLREDICPACCGAERENSIDCPFDCEYLREARQHEQAAALAAEDLPNRDIRVTEDFLREHDSLVLWLTMGLARAMETGKAVDSDAREALDALIRTYRTLESGLIYETKPQNPYAARIQDELKQSIEELRKRLQQEVGMQTLRDSEILAVLVFLQRLEFTRNNGRRRGRAFLDFLRASFPTPAEAAVQP